MLIKVWSRYRRNNRSCSTFGSKFIPKVSGTKSIFVQSQRNGGLVFSIWACIPQQNGRIESTAGGVDISRAGFYEFDEFQKFFYDHMISYFFTQSYADFD